MTLRRALSGLVAVSAAAAALPGLAAAQLPPPLTTAPSAFSTQPQQYLLSVDAADARALWLQPAGLSRRAEAAVGLFAGSDANGLGGLRQYGVNLSSRGLGLGWQHDRGVSGVSVNTWSFGFAAGHERASVGATRSWYRGTNTKSSSVDIGGRMMPRPMFELSFVWRDIGSPVILGDTLFSTLVPAAAINLLGGRARLGAEWEIVARDRGTSAMRAGASMALMAGLVLAGRADFDGSGDLASVGLALSWSGRPARVSTFYRDRRNGASDPFGVWAALVQPLGVPRRPGLR